MRLQAALGETYRVQKELGGGGMSRVFLAEETRLGRQVVIKLLPPEMGAAVNVERFEREIQLAARLQHPHIVPLLTAAASGDLLYYIMPYISGESLRAKVAREGALPVNEAVRILREVVDALAYAHGHGVVHRDIKPDNVLLSTGHAVVTDFGVAKAVSASSGSSSLTSLGVALGTPAYMAPEQAAADPNVDHRADIYSVGALAYEMLTGRPPFNAPTPQAMLAAHITQSPDPITKHRPTVPAAVNTLLMHCLEKHPADRFQTAAELLAQLEIVLTPSGGMTPSTATPAISSGTEEALKKSHPTRVAAGFGAASVATLAIVWLAVHQFGLPYWVFYGAIVLLLIGLPIILTTGYFERKRAVARATGRIIPPAASGVHRLFTWKKAIRGGFLAFAGLTILTIIYTAMRVMGIGSVGTLVASGRLNQADRLLVADFENRTPDPGIASSITEAFRIDLSQSRTLRILEASQVRDGLQRMERDPATPITGNLARELAAREGAKAIVAGEISSLGKSYIVSARIISATDGKELIALRETAESDADIVNAVDRLSGKVRERIGESLKTIRDTRPLDQMTTRSLEALRLYTEGAGQVDVGQIEEGIAKLKQAIALDSGFAMAWRKLAVAYGNSLGSQALAIDAATRAYEYRDRLPELERLYATAYYYTNVDIDPARQIAAYRQVLALDPDNRIATNNLSITLTALGHPVEAESLIAPQTAKSDRPDNGWTNLANAQLTQGDTARVRRTVDDLVTRWPDSPLALWTRAFVLAEMFDWDGARRAWTKLGLNSEPEQRWRSHQGLAGIATSQGQMAEADRQTDEAIAASVRRGLSGAALSGYLSKAMAISKLQSDTAAAFRVVDQGLQRHPLDSIPAFDRPGARLAVVYALAGNLPKARQALKQYEQDLPIGLRRGEWEWFRARGLIALQSGDANGALKAFTEGDGVDSCPDCLNWEKGVALERLGQTDSALAAYQRAAAPGSGWKSLSDPLALAPSLKRLGEIYEERKDTQRALQNYGRFVELWKNADPLLQPQVREVKARMAKLAGEPK